MSQNKHIAQMSAYNSEWKRSDFSFLWLNVWLEQQVFEGNGQKDKQKPPSEFSHCLSSKKKSILNTAKHNTCLPVKFWIANFASFSVFTVSYVYFLKKHFVLLLVSTLNAKV